MIVYTGAFVIAEIAAGRVMTVPRIGIHSWARDRTAAHVTVSSEAAGAPRDAPLRPDTYEFWLPTAMPATWRVDLGTLRDVDYVGVAAHTLGTASASIAVHTSTNATDWTAFSDSLVPTDDSPIMFLDSVVSARYVRLTLTGSTAPRIAVVYAGLSLMMERGVQAGHGPLPLSRETVLTQKLSRTGQFLGQSFRKLGVVGSASFVGLDTFWYRTYFDPFVKEARKYPFFFAWHPQDYPNELAYAWLTDDIAPSQQLAGIVNVSMNMVGLGNE